MRLLSSLLPAVIPSWRFFDRIGPAPTVEWSVGDGGWQPVCPSPPRVPAAALLARLFWNPARNEALFLVSCAERLLDDPSASRADLLWTRVADRVRPTLSSEAAVAAPALPSAGGRTLRVRIVEVTRQGDALLREVRYVSEPRPL